MSEKCEKYTTVTSSLVPDIFLRPRPPSYYVFIVPTPDALCLSFDYVITLDRVSPLRSSAIYRRAHVIDLPLMP